MQANGDIKYWYVKCKVVGFQNCDNYYSLINILPIGIEQYFRMPTIRSDDTYRVLRLHGVGCTGDESQFANCSVWAIGDIHDSDRRRCWNVASMQCITGLLCK